jgi:hypothetical protein
MTDSEALAEFERGHVLTFTVTDVWGREREARIYPLQYDGRSGFGCPFCSSVTLDRGDSRFPRCENPICQAQALPTDTCADRCRALWLDSAHDAALGEAENRRRAETHRWNMERIRQDNEARNADYNARRAEAEKRGACPRCATKDMYRPARYIRHRVACSTR